MITMKSSFTLLLSLPFLSHTVTAECDDGTVAAFAAGEAALQFGADSSTLCSQFCLPEVALQFIPTAQPGTCSDQGFPEEVMAAREITIDGSPMPLDVTIYGAAASEDGGDDEVTEEDGCEEGSVSVMVTGQAATNYGAESSDLCSQFCAPEVALSFIPNAEAGACVDQGYSVEMLSDVEVQLEGSPTAFVVSIYAKQMDAPLTECEEGSVIAYAMGEDAQAFGASGNDFCAEFCVPQAALQFIANATEGDCFTMGYGALVSSSNMVQLEGSPNPLSVTLYFASPEETDTEVDMWDYPQPSEFEGPCVDCPEYVALSGEEKLDRIWDKITAYEYDEIPTNWLYKRTNPTVTEMINDFPDKSRVNMVFDRVSDERPPNFPRLLHEYGSVAKIAFEPTPGNNFTGLYAEGNDFGIIRVTFCAPFDGEATGARVPFAFAAKFFRDGIHSSNIPVCEGPDREWLGRDPEGFSVFQHALHTSSIIPPPIDIFFANAQNGTGPLSIADNTWYTREGTPVEDPLSPLIIHMFPNEALNTKDAYQEDFRRELPELPVNTTLYTAYTPVDDEGNPTICICHSTPDGEIPCFNRESLAGKCNLVELGSIVSKSKFIHSSYGDNGVLFKHYRSCQEDRKYCQYNQPIPEIDSTFTKSSDPNGTCVSRRRVDNYETCPFLDAANAVEGMELLETSDYCSTPDEHELENMCPFAQSLHPSFSANSVPYPIAMDEHLRSCEILSTSSTTAMARSGHVAPYPVVSIACCRAVNEYFVEETRDMALQSLCNMDDCYDEFEVAFPDVDLDAECAEVDPVAECKFDLQAGPQTIPINLGFVTEGCCEAAETHAGGGDSLDVVCEDRSCILAYSSLFTQGQAFANPGSTETLEEVCIAMEPEEEEVVTEPEEEETGEETEPEEEALPVEKTTTQEKEIDAPTEEGSATVQDEGLTSAGALRFGSFVLLLSAASVALLF